MLSIGKRDRKREREREREMTYPLTSISKNWPSFGRVIYCDNIHTAYFQLRISPFVLDKAMRRFFRCVLYNIESGSIWDTPPHTHTHHFFFLKFFKLLFFNRPDKVIIFDASKYLIIFIPFVVILLFSCIVKPINDS